MSYGEPGSTAEGAPCSHNNSPSHSRSCCFCFPCFSGSQRSSSAALVWWENVRTASLSQSRAIQSEERWWSRGIGACVKAREWSEMVAGPKWKTFIRRFNKTKSGRHLKFQYDPLSYALNFDEGPISDGIYEVEDYEGYRNFSTRYAVVPGPNQAKPSVANSVKEAQVFG